MKRLAVLSMAALALAACGGGDEVAATAQEGDEFCTLAQVASDDNDTLQDVDGNDPDAVKRDLGIAIDSLTAAAAKAPKDISDTIKALLANEVALEGLLKDNDYNIFQVAETEEGKELLEDESGDEIADDLEAYLSDKCGIESGDDDTSDTVADDATTDTVADDATSDTIGDPLVDLGEGEDAINQFLDFYELGTSTTLTDDERSCIVDALVDEVTGDDLNQAISGEASPEVEQALGLAFINCDVAVG